MKDGDRQLAERAMAAQRDGRTAQAEALWRHLLAVDRANAAASYHLGVLLANEGRLDEAAQEFEHVLTLLPNSAEAAGNLGFVRQRQARLQDAVELYRRALALDPQLATIRNNLGGALQELGCAAEAFEVYRPLADSPEPRVAANFLTALNLVPGSLATIRAAAESWAARFADPVTPPRRPLRDDPERRLRVGYVGADGLRRHTLAMTWLPLIEAHDPAAVEVVLYSDVPDRLEDDVSRRFQAVAAWQRTVALDDAALARRIRDDRIDILVDGIGFAAGCRLVAFAPRPAAIQIHFPPMATTGMAAMDCILADEHLIPPEAEKHFREAIWRLPCGFLYRPFDPPPDPTPGGAADRPVTFGSFNRLAKIGPAVVETWARILKAVPDARLILKTGGHLTPEMVERYRALFGAAGVAPERLEFRGRSPDAEHLRQLRDIDILLDPFPHGGVLTTCDALLMGVHVVTLAGERVLERYTASLLAAVGFEAGIARSLDDYVERARALAANRARLDTLRLELSTRMKASPLCDAPAFARAVESAYRALWRRQCGEPG